MRIHIFFIFIFLLASPAFAYTIEGNTIIYENAYGKLEVTPHTTQGFMEQEQYATITSYIATQDLDFAFMFDFPITGSVYVLNGEQWIDRTSLFEHDVYNDKHFYWINNVNFEWNETKNVKWKYNTPINSSGKWDLWIKRSSDTIAEALGSGLYVRLDPWWNSDWLKRTNITLNNTGTTTLNNQQVFINVSFLTGMQADFDDLRFTFINLSTQAETPIDYYIRQKSDSNYADIWVEVTEIPASSNATIRMYFNSTVSIAGSNFNTTFTKNYLNDNTLQLEYNLDTGSGLTAVDGANNLNGTIIGGTSWLGTDGGFWGIEPSIFFTEGDALDIATGQGFTVANATYNYFIDQPFTIEAWIYPDAYADWENVIRKTTQTSANFGYQLMISNTDQIRWLIGDGSTSYSIMNSSTAITVGKWMHVMAVWNTTQLLLYFNAALMGNATAPISLGATNEGVQVGEWDASGTQDFVGDMDSIRIYNRSLSQAEIQAHYERRKYNDSVITYVINATAEDFAAVTNGLRIVAVFDEDTLAEIADYNITVIASSGGVIYNDTSGGTTLTIIDISDLQTGEVIVRLDKAGYSFREYRVTLSNTTLTTITGYLLTTANSNLITFQVKSDTDVFQSGVSTRVEKFISNVWTMMTNGSTDSSGIITFYMNDETFYRVTFVKTGFETANITVRPLSSTYVQVLESVVLIDYSNVFDGIDYRFDPDQSVWSQTNEVEFKYFVNAIEEDLIYYAFNVTWNGTESLSFETNATTIGGTLNYTLNLSTYTGNITVIGTFERTGFPTVNITKIYQISNMTSQGFTLWDVINALKNETHDVPREVGSIIILFVIMMAIGSIGLLGSSTGAGIAGVMLLTIVFFIGALTWEMFILIALVTVSIIFMKERL